MKIIVRPSEERGHVDMGWLNARHSFSFGHYYDPDHMGYRDLRVINEDIVKPASGFPTHAHENMEIVTYIVKGALSHKDSTGSEGVIARGDVQAMSAGSGVHHSEFNASRDENVRLLQIWIMPARDGGAPAYGQANIPAQEKHNALRLIAAPKGEGGGLPIGQDARIYASVLDAGAALTHVLKPGRGAWVQMVDGEVDIGGTVLKSGDGAAIEDTAQIAVTAKKNSEFLLFDLA